MIVGARSMREIENDRGVTARKTENQDAVDDVVQPIPSSRSSPAAIIMARIFGYPSREFG
jgi:hypothetical protein